MHESILVQVTSSTQVQKTYYKRRSQTLFISTLNLTELPIWLNGLVYITYSIIYTEIVVIPAWSIIYEIPFQRTYPLSELGIWALDHLIHEMLRGWVHYWSYRGPDRYNWFLHTESIDRICPAPCLRGSNNLLDSPNRLDVLGDKRLSYPTSVGIGLECSAGTQTYIEVEVRLSFHPWSIHIYQRWLPLPLLSTRPLPPDDGLWNWWMMPYTDMALHGYGGDSTHLPSVHISPSAYIYRGPIRV